MLSQAPKQAAIGTVPLTVHYYDYELTVSAKMNNCQLRLRTPRRQWLSLYLQARPWQYELLSRVYGFLELQSTSQGWYAGFNVYQSLRPKAGIVPLLIRTAAEAEA